ncbi:MAG: DegV family protein [Clostridia bacterium]|jgi:DegV family protein with EDD domain|nr:DegV family protein [Clostridia bacterium]MBT7121512.1 DegV family protein [Clostridia bacterium]
MIKLICDSTSYLPGELIEKYNIDIIPLSVILGPEVIDETQITNETFFARLKRSAFHPSSAHPTAQAIYSVFKQYTAAGDSVLFTCVSSDLSTTFSTALTVKNQLLEEYPKARVEVVNTQSNCMGHGFATLAGAKAVAAGKNMDEAIAAINNTIPKIRLLFIPESLKYLQESGRLNKASALAASVLKIVPILTVKDGKLDLHAKIRTRIKAKKVMLAELLNDIESGGVSDISVMHVNDEKEAQQFMASIKELIDIDINLVSIGPVVGAHVGPGTLGLAWVKS